MVADTSNIVATNLFITERSRINTAFLFKEYIMKKLQDVDFNYDEIIDEINKSSKDTAIYVGCDSVRKKKLVAYVTVIVIHKNGKHGAKIFKDIKVTPNYEKSAKAVRMRLMSEVTYAVDAASHIVDVVGDREFAIHLDINPDPKFASSVVHKEATGYVLGTFGFKPKLKPFAMVASFAADKYANEITKHIKNKTVFV